MNLIGKMIGNRYEILSEAGNGGMATVYEAKDHVLNRMVAVKVLKDEYTTDTDFIKRFNTEAQSAASLSHPNIVSIYDVGHEEENNLYYIVMELIKGKTLKEIINKDGALSWKWSVNIAIQIASALELAHKNGIIHRDIKPHNIIITEDGVAKVTDFGIAKAVSNSTITAFGTTIGSVHYFSPEQARGSVTDAKSDLYSLGVVMYEMLTGKVPFDADTPVSVALKHMQEDPVPPIEVNDEIPTAINQIVMKAMQKEPINRYQSATEMLSDLSKALKDPDGDFVIIENKDGGYTRVMQAVKDDKAEQNSKSKAKGLKAFFAKHPKAKAPIFILCLIILFFIVFFATKIVLDGGISTKVSIPNLVGMTQEEAQKAADDKKLKLDISEAASSDVEAGKVISQDPSSENDKVKEGTKIKIIISKGPETTALPKLEGMKIDDARNEAIELGITLKEENENSETVQEGYIIKQDTTVGTMIKSGDTVTVHVSSGVAKTKVPTVIGMDEGTAKATLANANLKANVTYTSDDTQTTGKVLSQSVDQGKEVAEGTTIDLTVNKIEKKNKTATLIITVPKVSDTSTNTTNSTSDDNVTVSLSINGTLKFSGKNAKPGDVIKETITSTGEQKIVVKVNSKTEIEKTINLDEYDDNANIYIQQ